MDPRLTLGIVLVVGAGLSLIVRRLFTSAPRITRLVEQSFWCDVRQRDVMAEFREEAWDDHRIDVARCSAFAPATAVTCGKDCLRPAELPPTRERATA